jgi:hypothetical protein
VCSPLPHHNKWPLLFSLALVDLENADL